MKFEKVTKCPEVPEIVFVEAVLMPNGELISNGKTIRWDKEPKALFRKVNDEH